MEQADWQEEQAWALRVQHAIRIQLEAQGTVAGRRHESAREQARLFGEEMVFDPSDVFALAQNLQQLELVQELETQAERADRDVNRLRLQQRRPYFARVDFLEGPATSARGSESFYIGVQGLADPASRTLLVYDWRTPLASLYYDAEPGPAYYEAPAGSISGILTLKRQYEFSLGVLTHYFDSAVHIGDDVLRAAIGARPDGLMHSIVETIQRDQNRAIRASSAPLLLITGPAGSGKTAVVLQRIAYLLYRHRPALEARHVALLSPSRLFAHYVSRVLPELGEENPLGLTFRDITTHILGEEGGGSRAEPSGGEDPADGFRAGPLFPERLAAWARAVSHDLRPMAFRSFGPVDAKPWVTADEMREWWTRDLGGEAASLRLEEISRRLGSVVRRRFSGWWERRREEGALQGAPLEGGDRARQRAADDFERRLSRFEFVDWRGLYRRCCADPDVLPPRIRLAGDQALDRTGLLWLRLCLTGEAPFAGVRQLVIDEGQDYTPLQYAVLGRLFRGAEVTITGDLWQRLQPGQALTAWDAMAPAWSLGAGTPKAALRVDLTASYRTNPAIMAFARALFPAGDRPVFTVEGLGRPPEPPEVREFPDQRSWLQGIIDAIADERQRATPTVAILAASPAQARALYARLGTGAVALVDDPDGSCPPGIVVMPVALAKGLEFHAVVLADGGVGWTPEHRYVAATRAIHRLHVVQGRGR